MSRDPGVWLAVFFTLSVFSSIFKENRAFYLAEHVFVGATSGYFVASTYATCIKPTVVVDVLEKGRWTYFIPIVLGLLFYARFSRKHQWLSRYPVALTTGVGAGVVLTKMWKPMVLDQIASTMKVSMTGVGPVVNAVLLAVAMLGTLSFFLFTFKPSGVLAVSSKFGRYIMMVAFGTVFGTTVMARTSTFIGRVAFLVQTWLGVMPR